MSLKKSDFNYDVPEELVAQHPLPERSDAKLLVYRNGVIEDHIVKQLPDIIPAGSIIVINDTKVIPSRIRFQLTSGADAEVLLLEPIAFADLPQHLHPGGASATSSDFEPWQVLARPMRKMSVGRVLELGHGLTGTVMTRNDSSTGPQPMVMAFNLTGQKLQDWLQRHAEMPLPPYIDRKHASSEEKSLDRDRYQTIFANKEGSVAAPTASLHLTEGILKRLQGNSCEIVNVTLHVGAGTFLPVKADNPTDHNMHTERFFIPKATIEKLQAAKKSDRPIIVVGTTALRSLEGFLQQTSGDDAELKLADHWLRTNIFIYPKSEHDRYKPKYCSALMTNFHQPESTLIMLVSALLGQKVRQDIYQHAIKNRYRLFSYGDSSLLWP
jgi:S-adenosylmethionine:tRNA ribosyltransferase-isomerase